MAFDPQPPSPPRQGRVWAAPTVFRRCSPHRLPTRPARPRPRLLRRRRPKPPHSSTSSSRDRNTHTLGGAARAPRGGRDRRAGQAGGGIAGLARRSGGNVQALGVAGLRPGEAGPISSPSPLRSLQRRRVGAHSTEAPRHRSESRGDSSGRGRRHTSDDPDHHQRGG